MAPIVEKGTFTKTTSTSTPVSQTVNLVNSSLTPKAIILWTAGHTAANTFVDDARFSYGFSDGVNDACQAYRMDESAKAETYIFRDDSIISIHDLVGAGETAVATVSGVAAGSFSLSWTVQSDTNALIIHYIVIGGSDITNASVVNTNPGDTVAGNHSYSGSGTTFTPQFALTMTGADGFIPSGTVSSSLDKATISVGATDGTRQWVVSGRDESVTTSDCDMYIDNAACIANHDPADGSIDFLANFVSFNNAAGGGITLNVTNTPTNAAQAISFLFLASSSTTGFECGTFQQRSGTGTQDVTFTNVVLDPSIVFLGGINTATNATVTANMYMGFGASDGTRHGCSYIGNTNGAATFTAVRNESNTKVYRISTPAATATSSTTQAECDMNDMATRGKFQLNWTTADTTLRRMAFWTVGEVPLLVTQTSTHKYNIIGRVTSTSTHRYHIGEKFLKTKVGIITKDTTTGAHTQNFTTELGFRPSAMIFWTTPNTAIGTGAGYLEAIGFTDGTNFWLSSLFSQDNTNSGGRHAARNTNTRCIVVEDTTAGSTTTLSEATVAFQDQGFDVVWTKANATQNKIMYWAIGGSIIENAKVTSQLHAGTGSRTYGTTGFQGDIAFFVGAPLAITANSSSSGLSFGAATSSSNQFCITDHSASPFPVDTARRQLTTKCIQGAIGGNPGTLETDAAFTAFTSTGYTLNYSVAATGDQFAALVIKGGLWDVGAFDQNTSNGTEQVSITTGRTPKTVLLGTFGNAATTSVIDHMRASFGLMDGTTEASTWAGWEDATAAITICKTDISDTKVIRTLDETSGGGTLQTEADFSSFQEDSFTINNTTTDATSRQICFVCLSEVVAATTPVSQTNVHKYNMRQYIAPTSIQKYNLRAYLSQTSIHKYTLRNFVAITTGIQKYNLRQYIPQTNIHKYNLRQYIPQTSIQKYNLRMFTVSLNIHKYNLRRFLSQTIIHKYNLRQNIAQTSIHKYNSIKQILQSNIQKYNLRALIAQTSIQKYNLRRLVVLDSIQKYNMRMFTPITTGIQKYNLRHFLAQTTIQKYNLRRFLSQTSIQKYNSRHYVQAGKAKLVIHIPLYIYPFHWITNNEWQQVSDLIAANPDIDFIVKINPNSGPDTSLNTDFIAGLNILTAGSNPLHMKILGYVYTSYGDRPIADVKTDIDRYQTWYGSYIRGIFLDEMEDDAGEESYYQEITAYCHDRNFLSWGNPGKSISESYVSSNSLDIFQISETDGYPSSGTITASTFSGAYPTGKFAIGVYNAATYNTSLIEDYATKAQYIFVTSDVGPNPYDTVSQYIDDLALHSRALLGSKQKYNLRQLIASTSIHKYTIIQIATVIATNIHKYNLRQYIPQTSIQKYHLRNFVSITALIQKYNLRQNIIQNSIQKYNLWRLVTVSSIQRYNLIQNILAASIQKYNLRQYIPQLSIHKYNMRAFVAITNTIQKYNLRQIVSQSSIHKYTLRITVAVTSSIHKYRLFAEALQTSIHKYNMRQNILASAIHKYHIIQVNQVIAVLIAKYNLRQYIVSPSIQKYNLRTIVAATTSIHKYNLIKTILLTNIHKYNIANTILLTTIHKYNLRQLVAQTSIHKYTLRHFIAQMSIQKYNLRHYLVQTNIHKYNLRQLILSTSIQKYNIIVQNMVLAALIMKYNMRQYITSPLIAKYYILNTVALTSIHKYNMRQTIIQISTHQYNLVARVLSNSIHKYNLRKNVAIDIYHKYNIRQLATATSIHKYNVISVLLVLSQTIHKYNLRRYVLANSIHKYTMGILKRHLVSMFNAPGKAIQNMKGSKLLQDFLHGVWPT